MIFTTCLISYSLSWIHGRIVGRPTVLSDIQRQAVLPSLERNEPYPDGGNLRSECFDHQPAETVNA